MADLSFAVAVTAASIVFETVLAKQVLDESVARLRWAGAFCVASGVALLAAWLGGPLEIEGASLANRATITLWLRPFAQILPVSF